MRNKVVKMKKEGTTQKKVLQPYSRALKKNNGKKAGKARGPNPAENGELFYHATRRAHIVKVIRPALYKKVRARARIFELVNRLAQSRKAKKG